MPLNKTLELGFYQKEEIEASDKRELLKKLLKKDLSFHSNRTNFGAHKLHSFPAKFPPQVPAMFIDHLTNAGQTVLDPMMGSGTTIIESIKRDRNAIGVDLDPLAILMVKVKTQNYDKSELSRIGKKVLNESYHLFSKHKSQVREIYDSRFSKKTKQFIEYWFSEEKIMELTSLIAAIEEIEHEEIKDFLKLVFSSTIITKTGGVSLAIDLAHTRPHKAKKVLNKNDKVLFEKDLSKYSEKRQAILTKKLRSAFKLFRTKLKENIQAVFENRNQSSQIYQADAQNLPIGNNKIDLIVTSPPYAANAIDYMRAHKFSLVWFGYEIDQLSKIRREYIGGESTSQFTFNKMPLLVQKKILELKETDKKRSQVLHRYFTEMYKTLSEMYRVLKPNSAAILVVGNSNLKNTNTELQNCLPEIGRKVGFDIPAIGIRNLDRDKRMMPTGFEINNASQIEKRMHLEYVIGFFKN
jgi:DNA modification methylase